MSNTRVPAAEITGFKGALLKRIIKQTLGQVPTSVGVYWHNQPVLMGMSGFGQKVQKWDACDEGLKTFAHMAVASYIGCTWCLDFNYFEARNKDVDMDKAREVPRWRESDVFTPLEREVMGYAEAMSQTPVTVDDEMVASLRDQIGDAALVELTAVIAFANFTTRPNVALGIESDGFAAACGLKPLAERTGNRGRRTVVTVSDPFVEHRSLLFTVAYEMLGSAADAEDVVQESWLRWSERRPGRGARPAGLPGPHRHPAVTQQAALAVAAPGGLRRRVAPRAAPHLTRRRRGHRARRERLDRDAHRPRDVGAGRAGRLRAARGLRHAVRRDRRGDRQVAGRGPADRAPRQGARRGAATPHGGQARRAGGGGREVPRSGAGRRHPGPARRARARRGDGRRRRRHRAGGAEADPRCRRRWRRSSGPRSGSTSSSRACRSRSTVCRVRGSTSRSTAPRRRSASSSRTAGSPGSTRCATRRSCSGSGAETLLQR